jgi:hypothetical protein
MPVTCCSSSDQYAKAQHAVWMCVRRQALSNCASVSGLIRRVIIQTRCSSRAASCRIGAAAAGTRVAGDLVPIISSCTGWAGSREAAEQDIRIWTPPAPPGRERRLRSLAGLWVVVFARKLGVGARRCIRSSAWPLRQDVRRRGQSLVPAALRCCGQRAGLADLQRRSAPA